MSADMERGAMEATGARRGEGGIGPAIAYVRKECLVGPLGPARTPRYQGERQGRRGQMVLSRILPLLVLVVSVGGILAGSASPAESLIGKGSQVPVFELPILGGGSFRLARELGDQPLLLVYWSLYCDVCRQDLPRIQKLCQRLGGAAKVKAVAINGDGKSAAPLVQKYWEKQGFTLPCLLDEESGDGFLVEGLLGVEETPAVVLLSAKGRVVYSQEGRVNLPSLEDAIRTEAR